MTDIKTFHNDDAEYADWWGRNPAGFVAGQERRKGLHAARFEMRVH
jgi:hypothetical protein